MSDRRRYWTGPLEELAAGVEPALPEYETGVLATELREHGEVGRTGPASLPATSGSRSRRAPSFACATSLRAGFFGRPANSPWKPRDSKPKATRAHGLQPRSVTQFG